MCAKLYAIRIINYSVLPNLDYLINLITIFFLFKIVYSLSIKIINLSHLLNWIIFYNIFFSKINISLYI